jgi:hypothetical protein
MAKIITWKKKKEKKKGKLKKLGQKMCSPKEPKKRKERANYPTHVRKLSHPHPLSFNVASMQIVRSNNNRRV